MLTLLTNRFQAYQPGQGTPVRITRGAPRWRLPYTLEHQVAQLAPAATYFNEPRPVFEAGYRADLDRLGAPRIAELLHAITAQTGDHRLVLLCFEDLSKGDWCHRRTFAQWWQDTTGDAVRELGPQPPTHEQTTLL